jgi:hypothetical protein
LIGGFTEVEAMIRDVKTMKESEWKCIT